MSCQQPEKLENTEQHILIPKSNELSAKITVFKRLSYNIDGKIKTVSQNGSYKLSKAGTYTVTYYCSNPEKSLKTGKYLIAEKKRKLTILGNG